MALMQSSCVILAPVHVCTHAYLRGDGLGEL